MLLPGRDARQGSSGVQCPCRSVHAHEQEIPKASTLTPKPEKICLSMPIVEARPPHLGHSRTPHSTSDTQDKASDTQDKAVSSLAPNTPPPPPDRGLHGSTARPGA